MFLTSEGPTIVTCNHSKIVTWFLFVFSGFIDVMHFDCEASRIFSDWLYNMREKECFLQCKRCKFSYTIDPRLWKIENPEQKLPFYDTKKRHRDEHCEEMQHGWIIF